MKIILIGDIHFRPNGLGDVAAAWVQICGWARQHKADLILQAGDIFDHANIHGKDADVGTVINAFLSPMSRDIPFFAIPGNHDIGRWTDMDSLAAIDKHPWITVQRTPAVVDLDGGVSVCAIPWFYRVHLEQKAISRGLSAKEAKKKVEGMLSGMMAGLAKKVKAAKDAGRFTVCIGHLEVTGAALEGGGVQAEGTYEFSPESMAALGADAYGLAHIHVRQHVHGLPNPNDGYLGIVAQHRFSEEGQRTGCRLMETDGRRIVSDVFLDTNEAPRYYTIAPDCESDAAYELPPGFREGVDKLSVQGKVRPRWLPPNVKFCYKPDVREVKTRVSDKIDADTPVERLLELWSGVSKCRVPLDALVSGAKAITTQVQPEADMVGSLERVLRIELKNITCHSHTVIDLDGVEGICGMEGPNGSGKTTAIEALIVGLYGEPPSRPSLQSLIPYGCDDTAEIDVEFESQGRAYVVRREFRLTPKTFGHKAYLWRKPLAPGPLEPLAGPKVDEVTRTCTALVGDQNLVLAGIFSSQSESGNIIELPPSKRKDLFAKLLGTDKFLAYAAVASRQAAAANVQIASAKGKIEMLRLELASEEADRAALTAVRGRLSAESGALALRKEELAAAQKAENERLSAMRRAADAEARASRIQTEGVEVKKKRDLLAALDRSPVDEALAKARAAAAKLEDMKKEVAALKTKRAEAAAEASRMREAASRMRAERLQRKETLLTEARAAWRKHDAEMDLVEKPLRDAVGTANTPLSLAKQALRNAEEREALLKGFPNEKVCASCPLASDGMRAAAEIPALKKALADAQAVYDEKFRKYDEFQARRSAALEVIKARMPDDDFEADVAVKAGSLDAQAREKEAETAKLVLSMEVVEAAKTLQAEAAKIPALEQTAKECDGAAMQIAAMDGRLSVLRKDLAAAKAEMAAAKAEIPQTKTDTKALADDLSRAEEAVRFLSQETGRCESRIEAHARRRKELAELEAKTAADSASVEVTNALAAAFDRDGIPQLITDNAIPRFQQVMADLVTEFDGRWAIKVASQKTSKSTGSVKDVIDILVDDGSGDRDIVTYSGGERKLLRSIIRIAFSTLQAERSGKGLKVLILDEAIDAMDAETSIGFVRTLSKLKSFNQIFVVSHNDRVLSSLPGCIIFSRTPGQPSVVAVRFPKKD